MVDYTWQPYSAHAVRTLLVCRVLTGYVDRVICMRIEEHARPGGKRGPSKVTREPTGTSTVSKTDAYI